MQQKGKSVIEVATELNAFMHKQTVYSHGWTVDKPWLIELFTAAKIPLLFSISPLELILNEYQMETWHSTKDNVIQETYKRTLAAQN